MSNVRPTQPPTQLQRQQLQRHMAPIRLAEGYYETPPGWAPYPPQRSFLRRFLSGVLIIIGLSSTVVLAYILLTSQGLMPTAMQMLQAGTGTQVAQKEPQEQQAEQAQAPQAPPKVPNDHVLRMLIRSTLIALNQANATGNYTVFRELGSPNFQSANSVAKLSDIFARLRQRDLDLSPVMLIEPKLIRPPEINQRGMLRLSGFFPSRPEQVVFDMMFEHVDKRWRIFGISVDTMPAPERREAPPAQAAPAPRAAPSAEAPAESPKAKPSPASAAKTKSQSAPAAAKPSSQAKPKAGQNDNPERLAPKSNVDVRDRIDALPDPSQKKREPEKRKPAWRSFNPFSR